MLNNETVYLYVNNHLSLFVNILMRLRCRYLLCCVGRGCSGASNIAVKHDIPEKICENTIMKSPVEKLLKNHEKLNQSDMMKVESHVQRESGDWVINTLMIEGCSVAFKYKRKKMYKNLNGQRVNLTYYADSENIAGMEIEVMKVVRIKVS